MSLVIEKSSTPNDKIMNAFFRQKALAACTWLAKLHAFGWDADRSIVCGLWDEGRVKIWSNIKYLHTGILKDIVMQLAII